MGSKALEAPAFIALLVTLGLSYVAGYAIGISLSGSVLIAVLLAFILPCLSMLGLLLVVPRIAGRRSDRAPIL